ncbi:hypothetical protein EJ03DRAFT_323135 [Teratosphaeria nubilosa]|uniref:Uncharacterized protein n=1 Tax=Teratosphaeria nubilosa TaxID=161662 RepID=A0A6G1LNP0_9PEZI|nr:hypothetical protein EJ03DRAFT_323135 [Teratosphaeria nubilosa]
MAAALASFDPATAGKHDPGSIIILFDGRDQGPAEAGVDSRGVQMNTLSNYYVWGLQKLGRSHYWNPPDLDPGMLRLVWWTHAGNEGHRDFTLFQCSAVKEMYNSLAAEGFRPMILGWSGENPYPMIGGVAPEPAPARPKLPGPTRVAASASVRYSGHGGAPESTPLQRVMAIIDKEEGKEAKKRADEVRIAEKADGLVV